MDMKNVLIFLIVGLSIGIVVGTMLILDDAMSQFKCPACPQAPACNLTCPVQKIADIEFAALVVEKFAEAHNYSIDRYDCENYSMELKEIGEQLGIHLEVKTGYQPDEDNDGVYQGHMWNQYCFDIEPQSGDTPLYDDKYPLSLD